MKEIAQESIGDDVKLGKCAGVKRFFSTSFIILSVSFKPRHNAGVVLQLLLSRRAEFRARQLYVKSHQHKAFIEGLYF
jgi:hypothetical protein